MKTYLFAALSILVASALPAQDNTRELNYIESSVGLSYPDWEGGRTELEFCDMNMDGNIDMVSIGDHGCPNVGTAQHGIMVWFGDGTGTWSVSMSGDFGYGGIAVGDVNNDGHWDVGYGMHHDYSSTDLGDQLLEVALGDGTGTSWTPWDDGLATAGETWGMFGTDFGDVDNDGDLDIGSCSFGSGAGVHIYLNQMDGSWYHSYGFLEGNCDMIFEFGDINNDGFLDFCVSHEYGTVYFGNGTGSFTLMDLNLPSSGWIGRMGPSLGDADGDGGEDLAFINGSGGVEVWIWDDSQEQWADFSGQLPASGDYEMTQLWDMNSDGKMDVCAYGQGQFTVWTGSGEGNWTEAGGFTTPPKGNAQAFRVGGDADHNGFPDVALVAEQGSWPSYINKFRFFKETKPVFGLNVRAVYPRGKELFWQNSMREIRWITAVPQGETATVDLHYSVTGPEGPWYEIATGLPDNGWYQWHIPLENSLDCHIRYSVNTGSSQNETVTTEAFTITDGTAGVPAISGEMDKPVISVYPNPVKEKATIVASNISENKVQLEVFDLQGRLITTLFPSEQSHNTLAYLWDCSAATPGCYYLRIITRDAILSEKIIVTGNSR